MSFERHQHKTGKDLPVTSHFTANEGATVGILGPKSCSSIQSGARALPATTDRSCAYPATCSLSLYHIIQSGRMRQTCNCSWSHQSIGTKQYLGFQFLPSFFF